MQRQSSLGEYYQALDPNLMKAYSKEELLHLLGKAHDTITKVKIEQMYFQQWTIQQAYGDQDITLNEMLEQKTREYMQTSADPGLARLAAWADVLDIIGWNDDFMKYAAADSILYREQWTKESHSIFSTLPAIGPSVYDRVLSMDSYHAGKVIALYWDKIKTEWQQRRENSDETLAESPFEEIRTRFRAILRSLPSDTVVDEKTRLELLCSVADDVSFYFRTPHEAREVFAAILFLATQEVDYQKFYEGFLNNEATVRTINKAANVGVKVSAGASAGGLSYFMYSLGHKAALALGIAENLFIINASHDDENAQWYEGALYPPLMAENIAGEVVYALLPDPLKDFLTAFYSNIYVYSYRYLAENTDLNEDHLEDISTTVADVLTSFLIVGLITLSNTKMRARRVERYAQNLGVDKPDLTRRTLNPPSVRRVVNYVRNKADDQGIRELPDSWMVEDNIEGLPAEKLFTNPEAVAREYLNEVPFINKGLYNEPWNPSIPPGIKSKVLIPDESLIEFREVLKQLRGREGIRLSEKEFIGRVKKIQGFGVFSDKKLAKMYRELISLKRNEYWKLINKNPQEIAEVVLPSPRVKFEIRRTPPINHSATGSCVYFPHSLSPKTFEHFKKHGWLIVEMKAELAPGVWAPVGAIHLKVVDDAILITSKGVKNVGKVIFIDGISAQNTIERLVPNWRESLYEYLKDLKNQGYTVVVGTWEDEFVPTALKFDRYLTSRQSSEYVLVRSTELATAYPYFNNDSDVYMINAEPPRLILEKKFMLHIKPLEDGRSLKARMLILKIRTNDGKLEEIKPAFEYHLSPERALPDKEKLYFLGYVVK